jgi:hypothetical protein
VKKADLVLTVAFRITYAHLLAGRATLAVPGLAHRRRSTRARTHVIAAHHRLSVGRPGAVRASPAEE